MFKKWPKSQRTLITTAREIVLDFVYEHPGSTEIAECALLGRVDLLDLFPEFGF